MADVLIVNSNFDLIHLLTVALEDEGLSVDTAVIADLRRDPGRIDELMRSGRPRCILFDVPPLYDENWAWFRGVFCVHPLVAEVPIVVTTTNLKALRSFGIEAPVLELVGKPFDINRIIEAIEHGLRYASSSTGARSV